MDSKRTWHDYVIKISDEKTAEPYSYMALFCSVVGSVEILVKGKATTVSRWSTLRKIVKSHLYRRRALRPRATDPDFDIEEEEVVEAIQDEAKEEPMSEEAIRDTIADTVTGFQLFSDHFTKNNPSMAASAHIAIAQATSKSIMAILPQLAAGVRADELNDKVVAGIGAPVLEVLPSQLFSAMALVESYGWEKVGTSVPAEHKACIDNCRQIVEKHGITQGSLSKLRLHAFFYIGSQMATLPCKIVGKDEANPLATEPLFTPLKAKLVALAMHDTDHSATVGPDRQQKLMSLLQRVSMKGRADDTFKTIVSSFFNSLDKLTACGEKKCDLAAHNVARLLLKEQLGTYERLELVKFLKDGGYTGINIPKSLDVFPVEKARAVQTILKAFDARNGIDSATVEFSSCFENEQFEMVVEAMLKDLAPPKASEVVVAADGEEAEKTNPPISIQTWCADVRKQELDLKECGEGGEDNEFFTYQQMKMLCMALQLDHYSNTACTMDAQGHNLETVGIKVKGAADKLQRIELIQVSSGDTVFRLFGRIVDEKVAATCNRAYLLPIAKLSGTQLFLDGSKSLNWKRSDCCLGWLIPDHKMKKDDAADKTEKVPKGKAKGKAKSKAKLTVKKKAVKKTATIAKT